MVGLIDPSGEFQRVNPAKTAQITDGHNVLLADVPTDWDVSFENSFDLADNHFPILIDYLYKISHELIGNSSLAVNCIDNVVYSDEFMRRVESSIWSLSIRSPQLRSNFTAMIRRFNASYSNKQIQRLVSANIKLIVESSQNLFKGGKICIIYSNDSEFVFGDGFYSTLSTSPQLGERTQALAPIVPNIAIYYVRNSSMNNAKRIFFKSIDGDETQFINRITALYSKNQLFFREVYPILHDCFKSGEHMMFEYHDHQYFRKLNSEMDAESKNYFGRIVIP